MKNCTKYQDDLKAYADGESSPLRHALVRRHLTRCASCRKEIEAMTQMTEDLRATEPEDTLPPTLREKLLAEPVASASEVGAGTPALKPPARRKRPLPAWAFAAVALVAWFIFYPLFSGVRENARRVNSDTSNPYTERQIKSFKPLPTRLPPPETTAESVSPTGAVPMPAMPAPPPKAVHALMAPQPVTTQNFANPGATPAAPPTADMLNADPDSLRQVHKEAGIGLRVTDPDATGDKLNDMVKETGGYVAANNLTTGDDGLKSGELIVKVPEPQFETFLAAVAKLGTVVSKNITGEDITEKTSDAHEAQSVQESDLEQAEARLKALGSHAKWEDQENTRDLRVQLAQTRARLKLLKRMAALGTITIDLSQTPKAAAAPPVTNGFLGTLQATTHDALQSLVGSAAALLALVIWLLAYSPIWVPLLLLGRYALKEYRKRDALSTHPD